MTYWRTRPISMMEDPNFRPMQRLSADNVVAVPPKNAKAGKPGKPGKNDASLADIAGNYGSKLARPQVYVHVEFGVSWSQRHVPNSHTLTYQSSALRDRLSATFPREVPAPNTNYLVDAAPTPAIKASATTPNEARLSAVSRPRISAVPPTAEVSVAPAAPSTAARPVAREPPRPESTVPHPTYSDYYYYQHQRPRLMQLQAEQAEQIERRSERHAVWNAMEEDRRYAQRHNEQQQQRQQKHHHNRTQHYTQNAPPALQLQPPQQQQARTVSYEQPPSSHQVRLMTPLEEESRSSRDSRSSHERGHSAPPPLSDSPWDVTVPENMAIPVGGSASNFAAPLSANFASGNHAFASSSSTAPVAGPPSLQYGNSAPPHIWKDLPEVPSRYRLGEDCLPWSVAQVEPIADPDDPRVRTRSQPASYPGGTAAVGSPPPAGFTSPRRRAAREAVRAAIEYPPNAAASDAVQPAFKNKPTVLPIQSSPNKLLQHTNADPQRFRELESLSAAMMTIDNGFENQWWNQGDRVPTLAAGGPISPTTSEPPQTAARLSASALPISSPEEDAAMGRVSYLQRANSLPPSVEEVAPLITTPLARARTTSLGWAIASPVSRDATPAGVPVTTTSAHNVSSAVSAASPMGGAFGGHIKNRSRDGSSSANTSAPLVSPVSEFGSNTWLMSPNQNRSMNRSMSTRSEELFLTGERYA